MARRCSALPTRRLLASACGNAMIDHRERQDPHPGGARSGRADRGGRRPHRRRHPDQVGRRSEPLRLSAVSIHGGRRKTEPDRHDPAAGRQLTSARDAAGRARDHRRRSSPSLLAIQVVQDGAVATVRRRAVTARRAAVAVAPGRDLDRTMAEIGACARRGRSAAPGNACARSTQIARKRAARCRALPDRRRVAQADGTGATGRAPVPRRPRPRPALRSGAIFPRRPLPAHRPDRARRWRKSRYSSRLVPASRRRSSRPRWPALRRRRGRFRSCAASSGTSPEFEPLVLAELAARRPQRRPGPGAWRVPATGGAAADGRRESVSTLIEQGQFAKAYAIWQRIGGVRAMAGGLFNPDFDASRRSAAVQLGICDPRRGRGARGERPAAGHLLRPRGRGARASSCCCLRPAAIGWQWTSPGNRATARRLAGRSAACRKTRSDLSAAATQGQRPIAGEFSVPQDCAAQRLATRPGRSATSRSRSNSRSAG